MSASRARLRRFASSRALPLFAVFGVLAVGCGPSGKTERAGAKVTAVLEVPAERIGVVDGVPILEGGYSGLAFDEAGGLWAITDRGPNLEAAAALGRPAKRFPLPDYRPHAQQVTVDSTGVRLGRRVAFGNAAGRPASGYPPPTRDPSLTVETALDVDFGDDGHDPEGIDSEGVAFGDGSMWVSEEYRPSIWRLDPASGRLLARYTPTPTGPLDAPLPAWLLQRRPNLGFEGLAYHEGHVYAALQGPLSPPGGDAYTPLVRILRLDPATGRTRSFVYALDGSQRKIGDLAVHPDGRLLVLEHGERFGGRWTAEVYAIDLGHVDYLNDDSLPPERFRDAATALTASVLIAPKQLYVDLLAAGYPARLTKPEGLAADAGGRLLIINDNDYGLDAPRGTGAAVATGVGTRLVVVE